MSKLCSFLRYFQDSVKVKIYKSEELIYEGVADINQVMSSVDKDYVVIPESVVLKQEYTVIKVK